MSLNIVRSWIDSAAPASLQDEVNATREIGQCLILQAVTESAQQANLQFQGGTCLRLFHGLDRFSEDLNYLLKPGAKVDLGGIARSVAAITAPYGFRFRTISRDKRFTALTFEDRTLFASMKTHYRGILDQKSAAGRVRIKIEVNTEPPESATDIAMSQVGHVGYSALCCDLPTLFSGKPHAFLSRTKGRDWYNLLWYAGKKVRLNRDFLKSAAEQSGIDLSEGIRNALRKRVAIAGISSLASDVSPFLRNPVSINGWDKNTFRAAIDALQLGEDDAAHDNGSDHDDATSSLNKPTGSRKRKRVVARESNTN